MVCMMYKSAAERTAAYMQATCRALAITIGKPADVHACMPALVAIIGRAHFALDDHQVLFSRVTYKARRQLARLAQELGVHIGARIGNEREPVTLADGRQFIARDGAWAPLEPPLPRTAPMQIIVAEPGLVADCIQDFEIITAAKPVAVDDHVLLFDHVPLRKRNALRSVSKRRELVIAIHIQAEGDVVELEDGRRFRVQGEEWRAERSA